MLQHVGLGVDRFGEIDPLVEPGEVDQEQHDAVRDVFALPSACLLVRADLFRAVGGFDPCDRLLRRRRRPVLAGAPRRRPSRGRARRHGPATARMLDERRPDLRPALAAGAPPDARRRHAHRRPPAAVDARPAVAGHAGRARRRHLLTARPREALGIAAGLCRAGAADAGDHRAAGGGSGLATRTRRARSPACKYAAAPASVRTCAVATMRPLDRETSIERRWRQTAGSAPTIAWICVIVAFTRRRRRVLISGVPDVRPVPAATRTARGRCSTDYRSGWSTHGLGATTSVPTGVALTAFASAATLFHMGLLHTVGVLGPVGRRLPGHVAPRLPVSARSGAHRRPGRVRRRAAAFAAAVDRPMGCTGVLRDDSVGDPPAASQRRDRIDRQQSASTSTAR